ncbi:DUF3087 family protein [Halomonas sp. HNIBRBA4712]|uniref:DUF3087 family protein n=1 Tax=Halomonas sp. HNIBRBA4712 TaxID=3373087 RepID=UPI00374691D7
MAFTLKEQDPARYRRKARMISVVMVGQLLIFGMLFSLLLASALGPSFWSLALGVVLGLLATSALFAGIKERPWMSEVGYVWELKSHLSRIAGYRETLDNAAGQDNRSALDILSFYHQGLDQMSSLNARQAPDPARQAQQARIVERRQALGLTERVATFDPHDLDAFTRD